MRFGALLPLACAITSFVLSIFCLLAGSPAGYMEDYHVVALNTSRLGYNLGAASQTSSSSSSPSASPTSIGSYISGIAHNITSSIEDDLQGIENSAIAKLAAEIGVKQWYSLHLLDMCEGSYSPNHTAAGASYNVSKCTNRTAMYHVDPSTMINDDLLAGKLHLNLTQIQWPDEISQGIQAIDTLLSATFVLYVIGVACCGLVIIFSAVEFFLPSSDTTSSINHHYSSRLVSILRSILAAMAFLALALASTIVTVFMVKATNVVNQYGNRIGVYAYKGDKFLGITWAAAIVMLLAIVVGLGVTCLRRRVRKREWAEKPMRGSL